MVRVLTTQNELCDFLSEQPRAVLKEQMIPLSQTSTPSWTCSHEGIEATESDLRDYKGTFVERRLLMMGDDRVRCLHQLVLIQHTGIVGLIIDDSQHVLLQASHSFGHFGGWKDQHLVLRPSLVCNGTRFQRRQRSGDPEPLSALFTQGDMPGIERYQAIGFKDPGKFGGSSYNDWYILMGQHDGLNQAVDALLPSELATSFCWLPIGLLADITNLVNAHVFELLGWWHMIRQRAAPPLPVNIGDFFIL